MTHYVHLQGATVRGGKGTHVTKVHLLSRVGPYVSREIVFGDGSMGADLAHVLFVVVVDLGVFHVG